MSAHAVFMLYWASQTLITAVRVGIFECLAAHPRTAAETAAALRLEPGATERMLLALTEMGFVRRRRGRFSNSPAAAAELVSRSPWYAGDIADHHAEQLWPLWQHLPIAIREGRSVVKEAFGNNPDPFDALTQTPDTTLTFLRGMHAGARGLGEALSDAHDFTRHVRVLDVGGGAGTVAVELARRFPYLRLTVFERPSVCAVLRGRLARLGLGDQVAAHPGDFFRPETFPPGHDVAVVCRVLHDWSDEHAAAILRHTHAALRRGGVVLVVENLLDAADPQTRMWVALSNLTMLVLTGAGRERRAAEYEALLRGAGFLQPRTVRLRGPLAVIKGRKGWV